MRRYSHNPYLFNKAQPIGKDGKLCDSAERLQDYSLFIGNWSITIPPDPRKLEKILERIGGIGCVKRVNFMACENNIWVATCAFALINNWGAFSKILEQNGKIFSYRDKRGVNKHLTFEVTKTRSYSIDSPPVEQNYFPMLK